MEVQRSREITGCLGRRRSNYVHPLRIAV